MKTTSSGVATFGFGAVAILVMLILPGCRENRPSAGSDATPATRTDDTTAKETKVGAIAGRPRHATTTLPTSRTAGLRLENNSAPYLTVTGRVTLEDSSPAAGSTVTLRAFSAYSAFRPLENLPALAETVADEQGQYNIARLEQGIYVLEARKSGFGVVSMDLNRGVSPLMTAARQESRDFQLKPAAPVEGMVIDGAGKPVAGAIVKARPTTDKRPQQGDVMHQNAITSTTADGHFRIDDFSATELAFVASADGHGFATHSAKAPGTGVRIVLPVNGASMSGRVVRKETAEPVAGATVTYLQFTGKDDFRLLGAGATAVSDASGRYELRNVPAGDYAASADLPPLRSYNPKSGEVKALKIRGDETSGGQDLYLYSGYTLTGFLRDGKTFKPLAGAVVSSLVTNAPGKSSSIESDASGQFHLENLFPYGNDRAYLRASLAGYSVCDGEGYKATAQGSGVDNGLELMLPKEDFNLSRTIDMLPQVTLSGNVVTEDGMPVTNGTVAKAASRTQEKPIKQAVDSSGKFELLVSPLSSVALVAEAPDFPSVEAAFEIGDESVTGTKIVLKQGARIRGTVVTEEGTPVPNAVVEALQPRDDRTYNRELMAFNASGKSLAQAKGDLKGAFSIPIVRPGEMELVATAEGYLKSFPQRFRLAAAETTSGLRLMVENPRYVAGIVTNEAQQPLAGAAVRADARMGGSVEMFTTETDSAGRYRLEKLPRTLMSLSASHSTYKSESKDGIQLSNPDVNFTLGEQKTITFIGTVLERTTERPITDFEVKGPTVEKVAENPSQFRVLVKSGRELSNITIAAPGYVAVTERVNLNGKNPAEQTFHLAPASVVRGRVVDKETKQPLANVEVTLIGIQQNYAYYMGGQERQQPAQTTSASDGRFELPGAAAGNNTVSFKPSDPYSPLYLDVAVETGTPADMGDVGLDTGARILGRVVRMPGDKPVGGTRISLTGNRSGVSKTVVSGANGAFEFIKLPNDHYSLNAGRNANLSVILEASESKEVTIRLGSVTLKGQVLHSNVPVEASISLQQGSYAQRLNRNVSTDSDGRFELTSLSPGKWNISINSQTHGYKTDTVQLPDTGTVEKTFILASGKIVGIVLDPDGKPVAGAGVSAKVLRSQYAAWNDVLPGNYNSGRGVHTGIDGAFELPDMEPGKYTVVAEKKATGKAKAEGVEVPEEGSSEKVTLTLQPIETGTLVSTALNMTTGGPIKEAWCILWNGDEKLSTSDQRGDDGVMTIKDIPAATYRVQVSSFGFAVSERQVTIEAGKTVNIEDVLYEAGAVRLAVQDANGGPVANADCTLTPDDPKSIEQPRRGKTDGSGLWVIRGLYPGTYSATAMSSGKTPVKGNTSVVAHQPVDLVLKLE
ncbi:MAG: carboxypeptidase regulatory-like domain-containing protein [Candidatus Sumerlaeaceae bacterium]